MQKETLRNTIFEFLRYAVVGGVAFLFDFGTLALLKELVWHDNLVLCTAVAFVVGLIVNYTLSLIFVFRSAEQQKSGRRVSAFLLFALIGVIGLGITEGITVAGECLLGSEGFWYLLVKAFAAGVTLIWNYIGRKVFVYHGK